MTLRTFDASLPGVLADYGWTSEVATCLAALAGGGQPGRIVRTDRGAVLVATPGGLRQIDLPSGSDPAPVAGDWLAVRGDPPELVLAPRRTALVRSDGQGSQTLAANLDEVFVLWPLDRPVAPGQLDRALVMAFDSGAAPVVVLTKADTCAGASEHAVEAAALAPGVDVVTTSTVDGRGLDALRARLRRGRTIALLGESGVGKSSLVNAVAGRQVQATGEVRARDRVGRHTTRARHLVPVGEGAVLVDTPGLRTLGVVGLRDGVARAFADVEELAAACRFNDCSHLAEPGCAVVDAIRRGDLVAARAGRYRALLEAAAAPPRARRKGGGRRY